MKILITGGHFSPAYSIIEELKKRHHEILIAGRKHPFEGDPSISYEYQICEKENLPFLEIKTGRFQRKFTSYTLSSLLKTPLGFIKAHQILRDSKPDLIMTFGGYIGLPVSLAAATIGIPVILHEQTQKAGLAGKIIGKVARKICISFAESIEFFDKNKVVFTGNPVRDEVFRVNKKNEIAKLLPQDMNVIYVTGGSTGSHFINTLIEKSVRDLLSNYILIHQTGDSLKFNDHERLMSLRENLPSDKKKRYILRKFIYPEEVGYVLSISDLILSRAGANIIFEIMALRKVSLLIPLPYGQISEQLENAKLLKSKGVGDYVLEKDANPPALIQKISEMLRNKKEYISNMKKIESYIIPDAASRIVDVIESYG
jgi:UDP-N-acetylglucosamine--N-acetylmuramyl-(pentapeptide) pyrophosphoryl-undecaprenol N-acetylglucosamine transferase